MATPSPRQPSRPAAQPPRRPAAQASTNAPKGEGLATAFKILVAAGVIGGAGYVGYEQYKKMHTPEPVAEEPKAKPTEKLPDIDPNAGLVVPDMNIKTPDKPVEEAKPVEEVKLAPLPALTALTKSEGLADLITATKARMADGRWEDHAKVLKTAILATLADRSRNAGVTQLDKFSEKPAFPLALAQVEIIERVGEKALAEFAKGGEGLSYRLLTTQDTAEAFVNNLVPEDHPADVLRVWNLLDGLEMSPEDKARYRNLALALALIHDKPNGEKRALEVYNYYRKEDAAHKLYVNFSKIKPDELVWGVGDHPFSLKDQEWAIKNLAFPLAKLGDAYPSIAYRINHPPYPEYTMETVKRMGGICMNQSQYAQGNARARGVPCAYISGEGSRGGHAWFGFRTERGWINDVGRYNDGYACGHASNPQTGKAMREWDLFLYNDPGRRNGDLEAGFRLARAAKIAGEAGDLEGKLGLLDACAHRNNGNPVAWELWVNALLEDKKERPVEYWQKIVDEYRIGMKECPDYFELSDKIETEKIFPKLDPDRVGEFLRKRRRQSIRDNPARFDLLTDSIKREADFYQSRKDEKRVANLYANSFREYGHNLPTFMRLADDFAARAGDSEIVRKAGLSVLESVFNKDVDSKLKGDTFALAMQAKVAKKVAEIFSKEGDDKKASKYSARSEEIAAEAKVKRDAMPG